MKTDLGIHDSNFKNFKKRMMKEKNWTEKEFNDWVYDELTIPFGKKFVDTLLFKGSFWSKIFGLKKQ